MTKVSCSVDSCEFYGQGNICMAEAISVKKNIGAGFDEELYNIEYAEELGIDGSEAFAPAETSTQTCCETMRPQANRLNEGDFFDHGPGCR